MSAIPSDPRPIPDDLLLAIDAALAAEGGALPADGGDEGEVLRLLHQYRRDTTTAPGMPFVPATVGRYEIVRPLGQGGFGMVFLAVDPDLKRPVALKLPQPHILLREDARRQFLHEARAAAALDHPNLVRIHDASVSGPVCYIASEYIDGQSLQSLIRDKGQMEPREAAELIRAVAEAVHHAHEKGVLHCDLTPANILLTSDTDGKLVPHVADFGLARIVNDSIGATTSYLIGGTPVYMAPEVRRGDKAQIDRPTDVYSLGAVLYELLTGRPAVLEPSIAGIDGRVSSILPRPSLLKGDIPADLEAVCLKCLEESPADRFRTTKEFADELGRFLDGKPTQSRPAGPLRRLWKWAGRPERIGQGGTITASVEAIFFIWCVGVIAAHVSGLYVLPDPGPAIRYGVFSTFLHMTICVIALNARKGRLWACLLAALMTTAMNLLGVVSVFARLHPEMGAIADGSPSLFMLDAFFSVMFWVTWFFSVCALIACLKLRSRERRQV